MLLHGHTAGMVHEAMAIGDNASNLESWTHVMLPTRLHTLCCLVAESPMHQDCTAFARRTLPPHANRILPNSNGSIIAVSYEARAFGVKR